MQSNDNANCVEKEDRFKYIDDLTILEVLCLTGILIEYDFHQHVPSDVGTDQLFLPPDQFQTQESINQITSWTKENLMKINESKTSYMIFTRAKTDFVTRLYVDNSKLDQLHEPKIIGVC